ncbi:uncharacterized protein XM38_012690 [Halomicronema hongdechloris C2206]|uniref:EF-hand domain-containing protein n=1 Tax=Halomicronema hongdechloris C2206 TaxID=1641165 RepID=A0A1Z3HJ57_9CYAN|nr:hormogonium polysaccharide biosynthesis protein HpsA [Halomicronema hongdechloris]ASC70331.1 uncharacterized protein XM38_012690 [Halomicronema hongdechloris C2206]
MASFRRHLRRFWQLPQTLLKRFMTRLLRLFWLVSQPSRLARSGFVLPTTTLLLLLIVLTAGALTFRSLGRSGQIIAQREQKVIVNAATPAIDRAKAKIEFLFNKDPRFPSGLPASDILADMMLDPAGMYTGRVSAIGDPYTLPDETRINLNPNHPDDEGLDNAWVFKSDINGDGTVASDEVVIYSILVDDAGPYEEADVTLQEPPSQNKAQALVTRTGPLATTEATELCQGAISEGGWQVVDAANNSTLQKNFQVNAFAINSNDVNRTLETLEFQQAREAERANKWGAWFNYDLEIFPGPDFNWNGAMHTDGNLFVRGGLNAHMVSSHNSCLYSQESSEITLSQDENNPDPDSGGFQGQVVKGAVTQDDFSGSSADFHLYQTDDNTPPRTGWDMGNGDDSVTTDAGAKLSDIATNPLTLLTKGIHEHIDPSTWDRDPNWPNSDASQQGRILNDNVIRPFVDDFYRADDRWGPKPKYNEEHGLEADNKQVGDPITAVGELTDENEGLDGFWERQAINRGLRLIVGERLELGNTYGWNASPLDTTSDPNITDPSSNPNNNPISQPDSLYPPDLTLGLTGADRGGPHEVLQRRSLRDNLAAVQGMVVYHYEGGGSASDGEFPAACVALTAHPGTMESIINSRTFDYLTLNTTTADDIKVDFLKGHGTNGWEFAYPSTFATASNFGTQYDLATSPLKKALKNLAYFAGDPHGGAPSFGPFQDDFVHPFPYLAMWGDFSPLRQIVESGTGYGSLSFADQATLHSSACTLGLLAYNLDSLNTEFDDITDAQWSDAASGIAKTLLDLVDNGVPLADVDTTPPDVWIEEAEAAGAPAAEIARMKVAADYWQVLRDRTFGFATGAGLEAAATPPTPLFGIYDQANGTFELDAVGTTYGDDPPISYNLSCDPNSFSDFGITDPEEALTLALALCPKTNVPKYPSLYYLFPRASHDQSASADSTELTALGIADTAQPTGEEYIDATAVDPGLIPPYLISSVLVNDGFTYQVVDDGADEPDNLSDLALVARVPGGTPTWQLPFTADSSADLDTSAGNQPDDRPFAINNPAGGILNIPFLDKGIYDGREQLAIRVLDIDLSRLANETNGSGDYWLAADRENGGEGIIYAFREDAVREDEIVRPKHTDAGWGPSATTDCSVLANLKTDNDCRMTVEPGGTIQDPPLSDRLVSPKPVDYYPDPMRRNHGFRFKDGADISGDLDRDPGMTFVTDNSVYIQGNFNLHSDDGVTPNLEEFVDGQTLNDGDVAYGDPFYTARTDLNTDTFATLDDDHWRPVEILSDSFTILSDNFQDGAVDDTFLEITPANYGAGESSYQNQNRPYFETDPSDPGSIFNRERWVQEGEWLYEEDVDPNTNDPDDPAAPVWIDRNGGYYINRYDDDSPPTADPWPNFELDNKDPFGVGNFIEFGFDSDDEKRHKRNLIRAGETFVNSLFISGIIPSQGGQNNGGFHNFPRFLELWNTGTTKSDETFNNAIDLFIAGSFFQFDFSTGSTGLFDQDAWERTQSADINENNIYFYSPPGRRWGFDVGLLYQPPAPAARRFVTIESPRSEYYRELPANDPYIENLLCATDDGGTRVFNASDFPNVTCP